MSDEQSRCYRVGTSVGAINSSLDCARYFSDHHELKSALYQITSAGKSISNTLPGAKDVVNPLRTRANKLLHLATALGEKSKKHSKFFSDQLSALAVYGREIQNRSEQACLQYAYPSQQPEALPPIPKEVVKAAETERALNTARMLKKHEAWLKKLNKGRDRKS